MSNEDRKQFPKGGGPASAPSGAKPADKEKKSEQMKAESDDRSGKHQERSTPPRNDDVAKQRQMAQENETAGRHKNDGQNDHQGNRRQPGTH
jgi:hypothetical protein